MLWALYNFMILFHIVSDMQKIIHEMKLPSRLESRYSRIT